MNSSCTDRIGDISTPLKSVLDGTTARLAVHMFTVHVLLTAFWKKSLMEALQCSCDHRNKGESEWKGLLNPLNKDVCKEVIRYGRFVQTVYDSYNDVQVSNGFGFARYGKSELFDKLHVKAGYTITKYIYCSVLLESLIGKVVNMMVPFSGHVTSWFGYVAVSNDEETRRLGRRDIVIVFRGTMEDIEWASNLLNSFQADISPTSSESMTPLVPLGSGKEVVSEEAAAGEPVAVVQATTTATTVKKGGLFGGVIGGIAGAAIQTTTAVVTTARDVAGAVVNLLPWQKVLIGNRWLVPYARSNDKDEHGFGKTSGRVQVMEALAALLERYKDEEVSISVTGHSLGAAIATVCAYDIVNEKKNINPATKAIIPVTGFTFASPRVGNLDFKSAVEKLAVDGLRILRVANLVDLVPQVPPILFGFIHAGHDFLLNTPDSKYVNFPTLNPGDPHNLELYLHLIANKSGSLEAHQLELVNKSSAVLKNPTVPGNWWAVENTDVVFVDGKWQMRKYNISSDNDEYN